MIGCGFEDVGSKARIPTEGGVFADEGAHPPIRAEQSWHVSLEPCCALGRRRRRPSYDASISSFRFGAACYEALPDWRSDQTRRCGIFDYLPIAASVAASAAPRKRTLTADWHVGAGCEGRLGSGKSCVARIACRGTVAMAEPHFTQGVQMENTTRNRPADANRDAISGAPGAHPVGTGVGALLGGAAAGALTGTVAGPVGTVVGAAVGAVIGGLAGKGVAESIDPTREDTYWRENYKHRPYVGDGSYDDFGPAYAYGVSSYGRYPGRKFREVEAYLSRDWDSARGKSSLSWERAKSAARDAWDRISD